MRNHLWFQGLLTSKKGPKIIETVDPIHSERQYTSHTNSSWIKPFSALLYYWYALAYMTRIICRNYPSLFCFFLSLPVTALSDITFWSLETTFCQKIKTMSDQIWTIFRTILKMLYKANIRQKGVISAPLIPPYVRTVACSAVHFSCKFCFYFTIGRPQQFPIRRFDWISVLVSVCKCQQY
jgi:hypothetical protein